MRLTLWRKAEVELSHHQLFLYLCGPTFVVGFILFGVIYEIAIDNALDQKAYVCDSNNLFYGPWRDTRVSGASLYRAYYFYNVTNPFEAFNGATFDMVELGPWTYNYDTVKYQIDFLHNGTVRYREQFIFHFSKRKSCDQCSEQSPINTVNIAWQVALLNARSEGILMLSTVCSTDQINQINNASAPYCSESQLGSASHPHCQCCQILTNCTTLVDPTKSTVVALLSWLAKLDGGLLASYDKPAVPLVNSVHSPTILTSTPREIIGGKPSAMMGLIGAKQSIATGNSDELDTLAKFTYEYMTGCKHHCPTYDSFLEGLLSTPQANRPAFIADHGCTGYINDTDAVVDDVKKEYLVGMQCSSAYFTFVGQFLGFGSSSDDVVCVSGYSAPCCLEVATFETFDDKPIPGFGCIRELPGYSVTRLTNNRDEWDETNTDAFEEYTGCSSGETALAQEFTEFKSKREVTTWFTPSTYTYPNMPYADNWYPRELKRGDPNGTQLISRVEGKDTPNRKPDGFTSGWFDYQGTDGRMNGFVATVFSRTLQVPTSFYFQDVVQMRGINIARFTMNYTELTAATKSNQQQGYGVPFAGFYAGLQYYDFAPVFISFPHFHGCDQRAFNQSDNSALGINSTNGVHVWTRVSDYKYGAPLLSSGNEILITPAFTRTREQEGLYDLYTYMDPWTGKALGSKVALLVSTSVWFCNPSIDGSCNILRVNHTNYCYPFNGTSLPCSAANVYTPKLLPGKLIPNFFIAEKDGINRKAAKLFHNAFLLRYISHITLVVGSVVGLLMILLAWHIGHKREFLRRQTSSSVKDNPISYIWGNETDDAKL